MGADMSLPKPVFELGLKAYLYGEEAVKLARAADRVSAETGVTLVLTPQAVDVSRIAAVVRHVRVFTQHLDPVTVGRGIGSVLAEAAREAGATGALLNHAEKRLTLSELSRTIGRAREVGLATMVCADSPEEAAAVAHLHPTAILAEPPSLIGTGEAVGKTMGPFIADSLAQVRRVDPEIVVICSAGIRTAEDVADVIRLGVEGSGSTSGVLKAEDPAATLEAMVRALQTAWNARGQ